MQKNKKDILWQADDTKKTLLAKFAKELAFCDENGVVKTQDLHEFSISKPKEFYSKLWDFLGIKGEKGGCIFKKGASLIEDEFFCDAKLNYAQNLLLGKDEDIALIFYDENGKRNELNYKNLRLKVKQTALALKKSGIKQGDRVVGIVPNCFEAIICHLGAAAIGAIWSSCSPDFGANAIIDRFSQIEPKILFCASAYSYGGKIFSLSDKINEVMKNISSIKEVVVFDFVNGGENLPKIKSQTGWFESWTARFAEEKFEYKQFAFNQPLVILFSSGTTGKPKCLIHSAGGLLITHKKEQQLHCDIKKGDSLFYFTTCGWMMWNWQLSALASGATLVLFDGNPFYPTPKRLFEILEKEKVTHFGTSARYIDACLKEGLTPKDEFDLSNLRAVFSTGSPLISSGFDWVYKNIGYVHLASISGGTDICACFVGANPAKPVYRGQIQGIMLGLDVDVVDENINSLIEEAGELVCKNSHPSMPIAFWGDEGDLRYKEAYFSRFKDIDIWAQGDWAKRTKEGGFVILGRSDATLNPGGVRIGTAEIYRSLSKIKVIVESVVIGKQIENDVEIWLFVKLKEGEKLDEVLKKEIKTSIRNGASPRHVPKRIFAVPDIPVTRSGKISEIAVRDIVHGKEIKNIGALANPESLRYFDGLF